MRKLLIILCLTPLFSFGQIEVTIYNHTGYDVDSFQLENMYIGKLAKDDSIIVNSLSKLSIQDDLPFANVNAIIPKIKKRKRAYTWCGTGIWKATKGDFKYSITLVEKDNSYSIWWGKHKPKTNSE